MEVKVLKLNENAVIPSYAKEGDAGMDLVATSKHYDNNGNVVFGTGLAMEIPDGYVGLIFPRSSNTKKDLVLSNSVGIIDSGYRGEIIFKFKPSVFFANKEGRIEENSVEYDIVTKPTSVGEAFKMRDYEIGDRVGQIIIIPRPFITFIEVGELSTSDRGEGGFGSTGS